MIAAMPTMRLDAWTALLPMANVALLIRGLFEHEASIECVLITLLSSLSYALLALALAVRVFESQQVLLGGRDSLRDLFGLPHGPSRVPPLKLMLLLFALVLIGTFYLSQWLAPHSVLATHLGVQIGCFLAPAWIAARLARFDLRETFALRAPRASLLLWSALLGLTVWTLASGVLARVAAPPAWVLQSLQGAIKPDQHDFPLSVTLLLMAALPALCEELLFRGFILSGLRQLGPRFAVPISATLFALAHGSVYHMLPTFALGCILGVLVARTGSIVYGCVAHALNNAAGLLLATGPSWAKPLGVVPGADALAWPATLLGVGIAALSLVAFVLLSRPSVAGSLGEPRAA